MGLEVQEIKEQITQSYEMFEKHLNGVSAKELSLEYGLSLKTVYNRLNLAREEFFKQIEEIGDKLRADLLQSYKKAEKELWDQWNQTRDPLYMAQLRGVWSDMRKMLSLDKPIKAAVNEKGQALPQAWVVVMDDSEYKKKELEVKQKQEEERTIEGEYRTIDSLDEGE